MSTKNRFNDRKQLQKNCIVTNTSGEKDGKSSKEKRGNSKENLLKNESLLVAIGVFIVSLYIFMWNGDLTIGGDSNPNMWLALRLASPGIAQSSMSFTFKPSENPCAFLWDYQPDPKSPHLDRGLTINHWNISTQAKMKDGSTKVKSAWELYKAKRIKFNSPMYYLVDIVSDTTTTTPKQYASTFGIGTAIVSAPFFFIYTQLVHPLTNPDICQYDKSHLAYISKLTASILTSASVSIIYLITKLIIDLNQQHNQQHHQQPFKNTRNYYSIFIAFIYAFGTSMWSINSQALWQHAPNTLFITLGLYYFIKGQNQLSNNNNNNSSIYISFMICCISLSIATFCRPTTALYPLLVALYMVSQFLFTAKNRYLVFKTTVVYGLTGMIFAALILYHNQYYFGSVFKNGQTIAAENLAPSKNSDGSSYAWPTPLLTGLSTLLLSPARGLLTHSPILILSFVGLVMMMFVRVRSNLVLLPFVSGAIIITLAASKFFDYWGGWCYGSRPLTDIVPICMTLVAISLPWLWSRYPVSRYIIGLLVLVSVLVHFTGAYSYDPMIWNYAKGYDNGTLIDDYDVIINQKQPPANSITINIDDPQFRYRLWDWKDSQFLHLFNRLSLARRVKVFNIQSWKQGRLN